MTDTVEVQVVERTVVEVATAGPQGIQGAQGIQGPSVSDDDKGDIVVSGSSATWTIDPTLLTAFMRSVTAAANASTARDLLGLEIGVDVQAYSAVLAGTTASFLTAHSTKLGHISVTQAVDLDAIETRVNALDAAVVLKGAWDASAGTFPGSGTAQAGDSYIVSVAGTVGGIAFALNDRLIAIVDNASTTVFAANWFKADYTDQVLSVAGKTGAVTLQVADITDMSANGRSLVSATDYSAMRTALTLVPGTNVQAYDATLAALAAFNTNGILTQTAADTFAARTITGTSPVQVANGSGVAGNPTISVDAATATAAGIVELATPAEVVTGTDTVRAVTPAGVTEAIGPPTDWTPALTFATPGDLAVTYTVQVGRYSVSGKKVVLEFAIATNTFTHTTASGVCQITGLPFTAETVANMVTVGGLSWSGITKAGVGSIVSAVVTADNKLTLRYSGSGIAAGQIAAADMPTGGTVILRGEITYFRA